MIRSSRTLATQCLLGILLCSTLFWRRAGGAGIKTTIFLNRNSGNETDSRQFKSPTLLHKISLYFLVLSTGIILALILSFVFLLLVALLDTFSRRDTKSKAERIRRGRIPKIVLDRVTRTDQNYGDVDDEPDRNEGERTGNDLEYFRPSRVDHDKSTIPNGGTNVNEKNVSKPLPYEPETSKPNFPNTALCSISPTPNPPAVITHNQEDYIRWIKSIYTIIQMTSAVQSHIQHTESTNYKLSADSNKGPQ